MIKCYFDTVESDKEMKIMFIKFDLSQSLLSNIYGDSLTVKSSEISYLNKYLNIIASTAINEIQKFEGNKNIEIDFGNKFDKKDIKIAKLVKKNNYFELELKGISF